MKRENKTKSTVNDLDITCPYVHALSSCPITHPHVFFLRSPCFLHVP